MVNSYFKLCSKKGVFKTNINFSDEEIIFIYGEFAKKINEINIIKQAPNNPFSNKTIKSQLKMYVEVLNKIDKTHPQLKEMFNYLYVRD